MSITRSVAGIRITHPDREIYPRLGLTKLDVARYFAAVAPRMLPHLVGRPLAVLRCPDGTAGECFFQKHWTGRIPEALTTVTLKQRDGRRLPYVMVRDVRGLVSLAQWGVVEIHPWGARADQPERPDRIVFDLDPGPGVEWGEVRDAARRLRRVLAGVGLAGWLKTSGGKGLHVVVPIERRIGWERAAAIARAVAEHLARREPARYLARADKRLRRGKIFVDWLRNGYGSTTVAPWSLRARPAAGISMPIAWRSLGRVGSGDHYTLAGSVPRGDPWRELPSSPARMSEAEAGRVVARLAG